MTGQRFFQYRAVSIWNSFDKDLKNHGVWDIQVLDSYLLIFLSYYDAKESRKKKKWPREILGQASRPKDLARPFIRELNVRFLFSSLPERQVFFIINTLFQDCPSLFLPGWPPNNPNKRKFFILFRFCTKSCCTNDRQILQLFFIMKGAELFYE